MIGCWRYTVAMMTIDLISAFECLSKKTFRGRILNIMNIIAVIKERFTDLTHFVDAFIEKYVKPKKTFAIMIIHFLLNADEIRSSL
jgi:hypothetical protein